MRRILFSIIVMISCCHLFAQNKKGYWMVGASFGSTGYSSGNSEISNSTFPTVYKSESSSFYLSINPYMGKYVSDNVVVGAGITLAPYSSKSKNPGAYESKTSYLYVAVDPFARFYLGNKNPKGAPFVQVNTGLSFYPGFKNTSTGGTGYTAKYDKYMSWNAGVEGGYEHFINSVIGLFYTLGYSYNHNDYTINYDFVTSPDYSNKSESHTHNVTFSVGLNIHLQSLKKK